MNLTVGILQITSTPTHIGAHIIFVHFIDFILTAIVSNNLNYFKMPMCDLLGFGAGNLLILLEYYKLSILHCSTLSNCVKVVMRNGLLTIQWIPMELKSNVQCTYSLLDSFQLHIRLMHTHTHTERETLHGAA